MNLSHENLIELSFSAFALAFSIGAAVFDLKTRKIPNWYNLSAFSIGLIARAICFFVSPQLFYDGLIGLGVGFLIFFPFFVLRIVGGGDIKLLAALGVILGWKNFLWTFILAHLIDGFFLMPFNLLKTVYQIWTLPTSIDDKIKNISIYAKDLKRKIPYAFPIALGGLAQLILLLFFPEFKSLIETLLAKRFSFI